MDSLNNMTNNQIEVSADKINILLKKIIILERTNIKTKKYNDSEMVKKLQKLIEEEIQCY